MPMKFYLSYSSIRLLYRALILIILMKVIVMILLNGRKFTLFFVLGFLFEELVNLVPRHECNNSKFFASKEMAFYLVNQ